MSENRIVEVYKADISLQEGESIQLFLEKLRAAVQEKFGKPRVGTKPGVYAWIRAVFADRVIFERDEEGPSLPRKNWSTSYTRKDNGDFQFGALTEVKEKIDFVPVSKSVEQPERIEFESVWKGLV